MSQTFLQELSNRDIDWLMATGRRQKIDADRLLIKAGHQINAFYILVNGSLTISVSQSSDRAFNRAFAAPEDRSTLGRDIIKINNGDVAGEELLVTTRGASTTVRTKLPSDVIMIPRQQLRAKLQLDLGFAARFYRGIAHLLTERLLLLTSQLSTTRLNSSTTRSREVLSAFGRFHDSDIVWMVNNGSYQYLPAGSVLLQEGKPAKTLYLLLKGLAKVSIAQTAKPSDSTFATSGTNDSSSLGKEIAIVRSGEFIGEMPFGDTRLASTTVRTVENSLVLAIPGRSLKLKLQQDLGWAALFEEVLAAKAAERFRDMINRLGYGRNFSSSDPVDIAVQN